MFSTPAKSQDSEISSSSSSIDIFVEKEKPFDILKHTFLDIFWIWKIEKGPLKIEK